MKSYYKYIMIKEIFEYKSDYEKPEFRQDHFGKYFLYYYPGSDIKKYYFDKDFILNEWKGFDGLYFASIEQSDNYTWKDNIVYFEDKYYILKNVNIRIDDYTRRSKGLLKRTISIEINPFGSDKEYVVKTLTGFKRLFKELKIEPYIKR